MKKYLPNVILGLLIATIFIGFPLAEAHAAGVVDGLAKLFGVSTIGEFFNFVVASMMNGLVSAMSWLIAIAGYLLNFSISLTLDIKSFVDSTDAIFSVWKTIRDITGIFMIFFLLWAALSLIVGMKHNFAHLIRNIIIAGVLINFSFFITSLGIDASNIVSVQIYNAIAPANPFNAGGANSNLFANSLSAKLDGGLSDIFANKLKLPLLHNPDLKPDTSGQGQGQQKNGTTAITKIILSGIVGIIIEFTAALSFFAASLAFIIRFVILLFLLAFSPIIFASVMIPQLKEYSSKWVHYYKAMLLFMPVYLLLMYFAMSVLNSSNLFGTAQAITGNGAWYSTYLVLAVNAALVILLLNVPLVAAVSIASKTIPIFDNMAKKYGAGAIWKGFGASSWRNTGSRALSKVADSETFKDAAARSRIAAWTLKQTRAGADSYNKKLASQVNERTEFAQSLGADQNKLNKENKTLRMWQNQMSAAKARGAHSFVINQLQANIDATKNRIADLEKIRQEKYAETTNTGSVDTLFSYVARKNKVAAAKIQIPVLENKLKQLKDDLKDTRADIKQLTNAIRNNPTGMPGGVPALGGTAVATPAQAAQLTNLQRDESNTTVAIRSLEDQIGDLKLTK